MNIIERIINHSNLYNPLRYSFISNAIVELVSNKTKRNIDFYNSFLAIEDLSEKPLVFDVGANKGNKAYAFARMGYNVICLEPEKKSLETLNYRFKNNQQVKIVPKGVSDSNKIIKLHIHDYRSGYNTFSDKWVNHLHDNGKERVGKNIDILESYDVETTTLDQLIEEFGMPLFVKIDVEGHELEVVSGLSKKVPYISFEANLPEFLKESQKIIEHFCSINNNATFKSAKYEQLEHNDWLNKEGILNYLKTTDNSVVEIIAKL